MSRYFSGNDNKRRREPSYEDRQIYRPPRATGPLRRPSGSGDYMPPSTSGPPRVPPSRDYGAHGPRRDGPRSSDRGPPPQRKRAHERETSPNKRKSAGVQIFDKPECSLKTIHKAIVARGQKEYSCFLAHMNHIEAPDHPGFLEATKEMLQPNGDKVIVEMKEFFHPKDCDPLALMQVASNSMGPCLLIHPETTDPDNEFALYCKELQDKRLVACVELKPPSSSPRDDAPQWLYLVPVVNLTQKFGLDNVRGMYGWVLPRDKDSPLVQVVCEGIEKRILNVVLNLDKTLVDTFGVDDPDRLAERIAPEDWEDLMKFRDEAHEKPHFVAERRWCTRTKWDDPGTSMIVHVREGWPLLRERLVDIKARVFVSTTESSSFAREVWRILDPKHELISEDKIRDGGRFAHDVLRTKCLDDFFPCVMADRKKLCPYPFTVIFDHQLESWGDWADQGVPVPVFDAYPSAPPPMPRNLKFMADLLNSIHYDYIQYLHKYLEDTMNEFRFRTNTARLPEPGSINKYIRSGCVNKGLLGRTSADSAPARTAQIPITPGGNAGQARAPLGNPAGRQDSFPVNNGTSGVNGFGPAHMLNHSELNANNNARGPGAYAAGAQRDGPGAQGGSAEMVERLRRAEDLVAQIQPVHEVAVLFHGIKERSTEAAERFKAQCVDMGKQMLDNPSATPARAGTSGIPSGSNTVPVKSAAVVPYSNPYPGAASRQHQVQEEVDPCSGATEDLDYQLAMAKVWPRDNYSPQKRTREDAYYEWMRIRLNDTDMSLINRMPIEPARNVQNNLMAFQQMKSNLERHNIHCEVHDLQMHENCYWKFGCILKVAGIHVGMGVGHKRKIAQHAAARASLDLLGLRTYDM